MYGNIPEDFFEIVSDHVVIKPISMRDAAEIYREFTSEITTYMYPKAADDISEIEAFIQKSMETNEAGTNLQIVIREKETGDFLGCGGVHQLVKEEPELGIWIKKGAHGHGYGLEAVSALILWAAKNLPCRSLVYPVDRRNFASRRIPEHHGGAIVREFRETSAGGVELDLVEYRVDLVQYRRL